MKTTETALIGIKVKNRLLRRLQKHISDKNFSQNKDLSQQEWIAKAIEEKLKKEQDSAEPDKNSLKVVHVSVRLPKELDHELQKRLASVRDSSVNDRNTSYSKKSWIIEAIEEKLEHDESFK